MGKLRQILNRPLGKLARAAQARAAARALIQHPLGQLCWTPYRARQQERAIARENEDYAAQAKTQGVPDELSADELSARLTQRLSTRQRQRHRRAASDGLHIVYATPLGLWERHNIPPALAKFGRVTPYYLKEQGFDDGAQDWEKNRESLDSAFGDYIEALHRRDPVDVLVSYLSGFHIQAETIQKINKLGIVTAAFWWDDRLWFRGRRGEDGRFSGAADLAPAYDLNLTSASDSIRKYLVEGGLAMFWPEAANPEHFYPRSNYPHTVYPASGRPPTTEIPATLSRRAGGAEQARFSYAVSFVGACYGPRADYIRYLRRRGIAVAAFGPGWPSGAVSAERMPEIYSQSRINLGFGGIGYSMKETCLKGRDFEVPMCGAVYLTTANPDLHRVYNVGREIVTYAGKADCLRQIERLLADPDRCAEIRLAARARCLREHTWEHRFRGAFRAMKLI